MDKSLDSTPGPAPGVETKVTASMLGAALAGALVWSLNEWVFDDGVPATFVAMAHLIVPALITFVSGYLAPHTPR